MHTLTLKIQDHVVDKVIYFLKNLPKKDIEIISDKSNEDGVNFNKNTNDQKSDLEILDKLFEQSNNKIEVTKKRAIDTSEMIG